MFGCDYLSAQQKVLVLTQDLLPWDIRQAIAWFDVLRFDFDDDSSELQP